MSALLSVESLTVAYGGIVAVHDFSLTVDEGEIVALIGANGAGKTSTLSAISGTIVPRAGKIMFRDEAIACLSPAERVARGIVLVLEVHTAQRVGHFHQLPFDVVVVLHDNVHVHIRYRIEMGEVLRGPYGPAKGIHQFVLWGVVAGGDRQ